MTYICMRSDNVPKHRAYRRAQWSSQGFGQDKAVSQCLRGACFRGAHKCIILIVLSRRGLYYDFPYWISTVLVNPSGREEPHKAVDRYE